MTTEPRIRVYRDNAIWHMSGCHEKTHALASYSPIYCSLGVTEIADAVRRSTEEQIRAEYGGATPEMVKRLAELVARPKGYRKADWEDSLKARTYLARLEEHDGLEKRKK